MANFFLDTEFHQDGTYVELISIGIVSEDGREYYAQNSTCPLEKSNDFVIANVLPLLDDVSWKTPEEIKEDVKAFTIQFDGDTYETPVFWTVNGNYDWVALCGSIFGGMVNTPPGFPYSCFDLYQYAYHVGIPKIPVAKPSSDVAHNALVDARWNLEAYQWLRNYERTSKKKKTKTEK